MKFKRFQTMLAALACVGIVCPPSVMAAAPTSGAKDVVLAPGGLLVGQVVDQQGTARVGSTVLIQQGNQEIVRTQTDENGVFAAQGIRGGQYLVVSEGGQSLCRLWAPNTAPPAASDAVVVVTGQEVVRGQWGPQYGGYGGRWLDWVRSHPYITAGIVAAAVATPLAVAASDNNNGPAS